LLRNGRGDPRVVTAEADRVYSDNPGSTVALPHDKYIHVVSEAGSPVQQTYIKSKDGLYIAAAIRKPKGSGRYPAIIIFHGAPGGRGMEQLVGWSRGDWGGPVSERFLQEGYVVAVADCRDPPLPPSA
jgi:dipeptidyl aminopeptidase/acylaminoacyl peptidase